MAPTALNSSEKVADGKKRAQTWIVCEVGGVMLGDGVSRHALSPQIRKQKDTEAVGSKVQQLIYQGNKRSALLGLL